ncbi:hypothetical protein K7432_004851 [Basidiobolus ranarum]|uniref:Uncharacterized protein n=1 Tax=Basidiobolus ranarum TaxID=34480 RepID=A0ABR2W4I0_9FUNG
MNKTSNGLTMLTLNLGYLVFDFLDFLPVTVRFSFNKTSSHLSVPTPYIYVGWCDFTARWRLLEITAVVCLVTVFILSLFIVFLKNNYLELEICCEVPSEI